MFHILYIHHNRPFFWDIFFFAEVSLLLKIKMADLAERVGAFVTETLSGRVDNQISTEVCLSFEAIAEHLNVDMEVAEEVMAEAISRGLVVGRIDQEKKMANCSSGSFKDFDSLIERIHLWQNTIETMKKLLVE